MKRLYLIVHNVRSTHNVGSLLRTADGLGIDKVYLTGYTPYPKKSGDHRLPHLANSVAKRIHKTALGAEKSISWNYQRDIEKLLAKLKTAGWQIAALEQTETAIDLTKFKTEWDTALVVGTEVGGLPVEVIALTDLQLQIPMSGKKESFNVAVAAAIGLYHLHFF